MRKFFFDWKAGADYHPHTGMRKHVQTSAFSSGSNARRGTATRTALLLIAASLAVPSADGKTIPHPRHQPKQVVRIIETLEGRWQQAELENNTNVMAAMLSDNYLGIYADGMLATKAETIAAFKDGSTRFTRLATSDRKIRVFGSTAVVVSKAEVIGVSDGESINGHYRYTRVYHRSDGVWKIVSFEVSSMQERKPARKPAH
ncbi:MAG: nuclear transport factor 2 family protein [Acidobacteriaceae bacterium]